MNKKEKDAVKKRLQTLLKESDSFKNFLDSTESQVREKTAALKARKNEDPDQDPLNFKDSIKELQYVNLKGRMVEQNMFGKWTSISEILFLCNILGVDLGMEKEEMGKLETYRDSCKDIVKEDKGELVFIQKEVEQSINKNIEDQSENADFIKKTVDQL